MISITVTAYAGGSIDIGGGAAAPLHLDRPRARRLVMAARMHSIDAFVAKLPELIADPAWAETIRERFAAATDASARWRLKEAFARLPIPAPQFEPDDSAEVVEQVRLTDLASEQSTASH